MHANIRPWLRLIAFLIIPAAAIGLFNHILIPGNEGVFYAHYELSHRDDVELALIGSSVVYSDFNPHIISEITGLETYNISSGHMALPGALTAAKVLYQTNRPKYVCLVVEPDTFDLTDEHRQAQQLLLPYTTNPLISIPYYLDLCSQDGLYFDRLLIFRSSMAKSMEEVKNAVAMRLDPEGYFQQSEFGQSGRYTGRGYYPDPREGNGEAALRFFGLRPTQDIAIESGIKPYFIKKMQQYKTLCEKNGSQLIVIASPNMLAHSLAKEGYVQKLMEISELCTQLDIPFLNFYFAREEFVPRLDHYYLDIMHMDYRAADIFSEKFAGILRDYLDGKDVSHYFYQTPEEFFASIRCITNAWVDKQSEGGQNIYTADCLHGASVTPEYSFHLLFPDGTTELLQPYSPSAEYVCAAGFHEGEKLRVYARPAGSDEESLIFADIGF